MEHNNFHGKNTRNFHFTASGPLTFPQGGNVTLNVAAAVGNTYQLMEGRIERFNDIFIDKWATSVFLPKTKVLLQVGLDTENSAMC